MGLIKALAGAANGVLADQWKEFFYCDALSSDVLVTKGKKRVSGRSSNTRGNDNIISSGSGIAVADGQCMIIVEQGKVVEVCAEPGQFTWDASTEPSIFTGSLGAGIKETFKQIGKRFTYGGDTGKDQRVYYFNMKEIVDNKFGTSTPIPFRVVDRRANFDQDVGLRCNGVYSYKLTDPLLFYQNVCGNVERDYTRDLLDNQLKSEFISGLQPSFARISELEIRPNALPAHVEELCEAMNGVLKKKWTEKRGIQVESIAINSITLSEEDQASLKEAQQSATYSDAGLGAGHLVHAKAKAVVDAANNANGAANGFFGYNMANGASGDINAEALYKIAADQKAAQAQAQPQPQAAPAADDKKIWVCSCGTSNNANFCQNCGKPKPVSTSWTCSCGSVNDGKFCPNCGKPKPVKKICPNCGYEAEEGSNAKFCPECGTALQ